jgi:hypothetical protein
VLDIGTATISRFRNLVRLGTFRLFQALSLPPPLQLR